MSEITTKGAGVKEGHTIRRLLIRLAARLFPPMCPHCGAITGEEHDPDCLRI